MNCWTSLVGCQVVWFAAAIGAGRGLALWPARRWPHATPAPAAFPQEHTS